MWSVPEEKSKDNNWRPAEVNASDILCLCICVYVCVCVYTTNYFLWGCVQVSFLSIRKKRISLAQICRQDWWMFWFGYPFLSRDQEKKRTQLIPQAKLTTTHTRTTHTGLIITTILLLLLLHVGTKIVQRVSRSFRCRRRRRSLKQSTLFWSCTLFSWYWTAAVCAFRTCFETRSTVGSTKRTRICTQTSSSDVTRCWNKSRCSKTLEWWRTRRESRRHKLDLKSLRGWPCTRGVQLE